MEGNEEREWKGKEEKGGKREERIGKKSKRRRKVEFGEKEKKK